MNLRRATAFAFVGWYLIVAPPQSFKNYEYHEVPLESGSTKRVLTLNLNATTKSQRDAIAFRTAKYTALKALCAMRGASQATIRASGKSSEVSHGLRMSTLQENYRAFNRA